MVKILKEWFKRSQEARARRAAMQELNKFTDRELQDLGFGRSEIYAKVYGIK
tara:strand:+ start:813 stop:968 length:156 start_codon:yes stop_codon:yes gene_type:complete